MAGNQTIQVYRVKKNTCIQIYNQIRKGKKNHLKQIYIKQSEETYGVWLEMAFKFTSGWFFIPVAAKAIEDTHTVHYWFFKYFNFFLFSGTWNSGNCPLNADWSNL